MSEYTNGKDNGTEDKDNGDTALSKHKDLVHLIQPLLYLLVGAAIVFLTAFFIVGCSVDNPFVQDAGKLVEHYHDGTLHAHEDGDEAHTHSGNGAEKEPVEREAVPDEEPAESENDLGE